MHPIYAALLQRPDLLAGHLLAYSDLVQIQARQLTRALRLRLWATLLGLAASALAGIWGGTGLMLAVMLEREHALLWWLPAGALLVAVSAAYLAMRPLPTAVLSELKAQLEEDAQALRLLQGQP
jgi:hypothetical protein